MALSHNTFRGSGGLHTLALPLPLKPKWGVMRSKTPSGIFGGSPGYPSCFTGKTPYDDIAPKRGHTSHNPSRVINRTLQDHIPLVMPCFIMRISAENIRGIRLAYPWHTHMAFRCVIAAHDTRHTAYAQHSRTAKGSGRSRGIRSGYPLPILFL